jgi:hypothetical protein
LILVDALEEAQEALAQERQRLPRHEPLLEDHEAVPLERLDVRGGELAVYDRGRRFSGS